MSVERKSRHGVICVLGMMTVLVLGQAYQAAADPVTVKGFVVGGFRTHDELIMVFDPGFSVTLPDVGISRGFCIEDCPLGTEIRLTQSTGDFSAESLENANGPDPDAPFRPATVSGNLSFVGPTEVLRFPGGGFEQSFFVDEPITWSGHARAVREGHVAFNGSLSGTGRATFAYELTNSGYVLDGYTYTLFPTVPQTPEPASIVLLGTGITWFAARRRR